MLPSDLAKLLPGIGAVPEQLPDEPYRPPAAGGALALYLLLRLALVLFLGVALAPLWPGYALLRLRFGRPPNVPRTQDLLHYLRAAWTESPPPPGLSWLQRAVVTQLLLRKLVVVPLWGSAWLLDELLYGKRLRAYALDAPLFEISAARSGSTQLARYLEEDPALSAPSIAQCMFPYLWLWRLLVACGAGRLDRTKVAARILSLMPPEFVERHEVDPFRADTFEGAVLTAHLQAYSLHLGPRFALEQFSPAAPNEHNRALWEEDLVAMAEGIGRKHLLWQGVLPGREPRLFYKGHFLASAPALARRWPDATFLTMIRAPAARLQSAINYLRVNPLDPALGAIPWPWLTELVVRSEVRYCEEEQRWFTAPEGPRRHVVRFDDFRHDLGGTLDALYAACLDHSVPPHLPRAHPPRRRHDYRVDRALPALGVDVGALEARVASYCAWCAGRDAA